MSKRLSLSERLSILRQRLADSRAKRTAAFMGLMAVFVGAAGVIANTSFEAAINAKKRDSETLRNLTGSQRDLLESQGPTPTTEKLDKAIDALIDDITDKLIDGVALQRDQIREHVRRAVEAVEWETIAPNYSLQRVADTEGGRPSLGPRTPGTLGGSRPEPPNTGHSTSLTAGGQHSVASIDGTRATPDESGLGSAAFSAPTTSTFRDARGVRHGIRGNSDWVSEAVGDLRWRFIERR